MARRARSPQTHRKSGRRRRPLFLNRITRDDRGVVAVEAAIVTPLFLLIIIGVIEFGLAFKDQLAITSAVRAGARIASAEPRVTSMATDAAAQVAQEAAAVDMKNVNALWVYQADSSGHPVGAGGTFDSCSTNCVQFSWDSGSKTFVQTGGSWPATAQNACQGTQDSVGVYLSFTHPGVTKAIFNTLGLHSYTVMRLEPVPPLQSGGCK
jgi:Flp pilus assembly protein TadG